MSDNGSAEGWKRDSISVSKVEAEVLCARDVTAMGEILFALFGNKILTFVKFRVKRKHKGLQVRLNPSYTAKDFKKLAINSCC